MHAEIGEIVAGVKPGRERDDETILFWHRGLSLSDIALGAAMLEKAARLGIGHRLRYADDPMELVANARMYAVTPAVAAAWRALFDWAARKSGVPLTYVDHAAPAPLEALWARDDLGAAFMCGFPFASAARKPRLLAAPVPSPPRYGGRAAILHRLHRARRSRIASLARHVRRTNRLDRRRIRNRATTRSATICLGIRERSRSTAAGSARWSRRAA